MLFTDVKVSLQPVKFAKLLFNQLLFQIKPDGYENYQAVSNETYSPSQQWDASSEICCSVAERESLPFITHQFEKAFNGLRFGAARNLLADYLAAGVAEYKACLSAKSRGSPVSSTLFRLGTYAYPI